MDKDFLLVQGSSDTGEIIDDVRVLSSLMYSPVIDRPNIQYDGNKITGGNLHDVWQSIVCATHIDQGNPYMKIDPALFMPPDLEHFMAVRCRAVSAMEVYGPNVNGDAFPESELVKSCNTLVGKGFYVEHASNDPRNAVGIIAHAQWLPEQKYVVAVALVDKIRFADRAATIRRDLSGKTAGVSIGCVAGTATCSICGNMAKRRHEICRCMDRGNPFCVKGRRMPNGTYAHDICANLTFYELSHTRTPADRDARPYVVQGAEEAPSTEASPAISIPNETELARLINKEAEQTVKSFVHKLVKSELDRQLASEFRGMQMELRPLIRKLVRSYNVTKQSEVK